MATKQPKFCYIDVDINKYRSKLANTAAFVDATDTRYGFSSKDLRSLGGSEISRIEDLITTDHEWAPRVSEIGGVQVRPPRAGNRIIVKLFWKIAPLACENFSTLCSNGDILPKKALKTTKSVPIGASGKPLTYRDSVIHRVVPGFIMQGGDFVFGNGSGGESIFNGKKFKDERAGLLLKHDKKGVLSMGNSGKNSNTSQFFITFGPASQCDGKHVVFGEVVSGWNVISAIEGTGTKTGAPSVAVEITACGIYDPSRTPPAGYWFDQPDDSYAGSSPVFVCRPRVAVLVPSTEIGEKFDMVLGSCVTTTIISLDEKNKDLGIPVESGERAREHLEKLLDSQAVDVILIAPACKQYISTQIPPAWTSARKNISFSISDVLIVSKPLGSLDALKTSWLCRTSWTFEWS